MAMTLRLNESDQELLDSLAAEQGISKHEAVVRAIRTSAVQLSHAQKVDSAIERGLERWAEVLDRLGR